MWSLEYIYFRGYGKMWLTAAPASMFSSELRYFLDDVSITPKEAKMVRLAMRNSWADELTAADFVDLREVKRILERVHANGEATNE